MSVVSTPSRLQRSIGALLGVHTGDSLGATFEFSSHAEIKKSHPDGLREMVGGGVFNLPAGAATDDTDMTRGVLLAYSDHLMGKGAALQELPPGGYCQTSNAAVGGCGESSPQEDHDVAKRAAQYFMDWLKGDWPGREKGSKPADIGGATLAGLMKFAAPTKQDQAAKIDQAIKLDQ
ncbi:hypothetical protein FQN49_001246, partial [Arthroderma sp. PD_2]